MCLGCLRNDDGYRGGTIVEVEGEAAMTSLPANVKAGLTAKAPGGRILKVESLTRNGKLVAYEAKVETAGKKSEIQVGLDGIAYFLVALALVP